MRDGLGRAFEFGGERYWVFSAGIAKDFGQRLSPAERLTAWYVAQGLSNEEVASRRGVALRTIANQVASILRKLAVHSRVEIAGSLFQQNEPKLTARNIRGPKGTSENVVTARR
jgi:DNA-binding CsgD family transcriptional regulator